MEPSTNYRMISDPGHGWLEVPTAEVSKLKIKVSGYSYQHKGFLYLEEDCDAPAFCQARDAAGWPAFTVDHVYQETTPVRNYRNYNGEI